MTGDLKDALAGRTEDEEAMCAVCSGGLSVAPNLIVFCERCDIAVHQKCYGVDDIPAGEFAMGEASLSTAVCLPLFTQVCLLWPVDCTVKETASCTTNFPTHHASVFSILQCTSFLRLAVTPFVCQLQSSSWCESVEAHFANKF